MTEPMKNQSADTERAPETVHVSIIILTKNGQRYLRSLLAALYGQAGVPGMEVIVIDSGSSDATLAIVAEFPDVRLVRIEPEEFGHGRTRNLGARLARGRYLVFMPQDATPVGEEWLARLIEPFGDARIAGVYARQIPRPDARATEAHFLGRTYPAEPEVRALGRGEVPSLARCFYSTVSGALRAEILARHPFREDIIMSEDQAWAAQVMQLGHRIAYQPAAAVLHSHHYRVGSIFRRNFDSGYSIRQIFSGSVGIAPGAALRALLAEVAHVARTGPLSELLRFFPYELARHAGFMLGLRAHLLPHRVRRACSDLKYFWDQAHARGR